jgi:FlaA1/EpsC-like NDP-sugar epimerase
MTRYFMTIPEAAALVVEASGLVGRSQGIGAVFVLDMGEPVGIVDLAMRFARSMGLTAVLPGNDASPSDGVRRGTESGPLVRIRITGARPGEKLHEELAHDPAALRPTEVAGVQRFDAEPVSLGEGEAMAERLRPWCGRAEKGAVIAAIAQEVPDFARPETERLLSCPPERVRAA